MTWITPDKLKAEAERTGQDAAALAAATELHAFLSGAIDGPLLHRHGGEIVRLVAIGHETRDGVADWFFVGDIRWQDGGVSRDREIPPTCVCTDGDDARSVATCRGLMARLDQYLHDEGSWHDTKFKRDGRAYSWTPARKAGRLELKPFNADGSQS